MHIYKVVNKINGKIYVGKTSKTVDGRIKEHLKESNRNKKSVFYKAIKKYGWSSFEVEILDSTCTTEDELEAMEIYFIKRLKTHYISGYGYNMTTGGDGIKKGTKLSEEHKKKIKLSQTLAGFIKRYGEEVGTERYNNKTKNQRQAQLQRYSNESERFKGANYGIKNGMYNKKHNKITLDKISAALTGKVASKETRVKLSLTKSGENNPMFGMGHKLNGSNNGRAKNWLLKNQNGAVIALNGNVIDYSERHGLSYELLFRFKNSFINIPLRKSKNIIDFERRQRTLGWGLFEKGESNE